MNILICNGSNRKKSNSANLLRYLCLTLENKGHNYSIINPQDIKPCIGCESCRNSLRCIHNDSVAEKMRDKIDAIIFVSPIYFFGLTSQVKKFLDRLFAFDLRYKILGLILTSGSNFRYGGADLILEQFQRIDEYCGTHTVTPYNKVTFDKITPCNELDQTGISNLINEVEQLYETYKEKD